MKRAEDWKKDRVKEESSLAEDGLEQKIDGMTDEYRAIKIPDELKSRVMQTMKETEEMMRQEENQNRGNRNENRNENKMKTSRTKKQGCY